MNTKPPRQPHRSAFTFYELVIALACLVVVALVLFATVFGNMATAKAPRTSCLNNLKQIGLAYCMWANDNGDRVPAQQSISNGGWADLLTNANQGPLCWTNYAIMSIDLGESTRIVVCPSDERRYATSFTNGFDNTNVSYFVGVSANDDYPQSIQGGDRNLGPGPKPDTAYGFSPKNGNGNDVAIPTNANLNTSTWSLKNHSVGNAAGGGNILLGDGSAQDCSSKDFRTAWLSHAAPTTNWPAGFKPASPSIRLVFP